MVILIILKQGLVMKNKLFFIVHLIGIVIVVALVMLL